MSDDEAIPTLRNTIIMELQIRLGSLPSNIYQQYFLLPYSSFIQQNTTSEMKTWLTMI